MPALVIHRRYNNSKTARTMKNVLTKMFSATLVDDNDYSDDDDIFEHKQMKDASDVSINDGYDIFEHQQRKGASDVILKDHITTTEKMIDEALVDV